MLTIKNPSEIDSIFKRGRRATTGPITVIAMRTPEARTLDGRVLFVAGKKLGGAIRRNRSKRVMRETVRRCGGPWRGWDVVLMARAETATVAALELDRSVVALIRKLGVDD